ncbi:MAG: DNA mismatch repair protein MutS [Anaerolineaceae bacterium]|nr:MAG: DNA mismatch repair protein MutS [Anaerolineaceae bacterium]
MIQVERDIEFDMIKQIWMEQALTNWAKDEIKNTIPYMSENELRAKLRDTTEARLLIEYLGRPPLVSLAGIKDMIQSAMRGECLSAMQLEEIEKSLVAVRRLKDYLCRGKQYELSLPYYEENLNSLESVQEIFRFQIRNGVVDDYASKQLKTLRSDIEKAKDKMKEKAENIMRVHKDCMSENFSTFRNGRMCVPVKKEYRHKVSGSVIDKSSTGNTLFIEPVSVAKYYEELQLLIIDEENEVRRILYSLTAMVSDNSEVMEQNMRMIEKLDYIFSKAKLSLELNATCPKINTDRIITLKDGRHPLMDESICVPLQFEIGNGVSGIVITGPNTGGKTVAIKTVALNCMMAQCGLHVTCREADICMSSNYLCDIGDGQDLSENLSTFSAHIKRVLYILKNINKDSLVIMDELGSGTDPTEGMGIAIAILDELKKSEALFLVTTHYPEVKQYAQKEDRIKNARMTFDKESLRPLFQLEIGEAGESCAFYISRRLGMPDSMLKTAMKAAYGENIPIDLELNTTGVEYRRQSRSGIRKIASNSKRNNPLEKFQLGDSVMVYPDKKIGIVCQTINDKGVLRVQLSDKKIWINHKRVKLHVAASELYPEDYDFSIIFDTVENRKLRHDMDRKYVEGAEITIE